VIALDRQDGVFVLRMQDGENRVNRESLRAWNGALDQVEAAPDPIALVTTGSGKFFSNGLDLVALGEGSPELRRDVIFGLQALLGRLLTFPCITVAAINGHAFAAGAMLALAQDYRVMRGDRGFFCMPEVDLGLPFTPPMQRLIQARLPAVTAHEAMVTGKRYGGDEARAAGLVSQSVPEAEVLPAAVALAKSLAGKDRRTLRMIKEGMYADVLAAIASYTLD
jgi:enoyl-CoA hydratase/carnithine racemase